jgi:8-oxo-dGTP diphosphatase
MPAMIVAGVLTVGDRILLCHRAPGRRWYPDVWDLPGGHIESGESAASALGRELHEELGIVVTSVSEHSFEQMHTPDFQLDIRLVDEWRGEPVNRAPDEHDAIGWFASDELGTLVLAHPAYPTLLQRVFGVR